MRVRSSLCLAAMVAALLAADARPSTAMVIYPWCAEYMGRYGAENCGFVTFKQCLATIAGNGGFCKPNPWYYPYPPSPNGAPPLWR
jgi:Protein of unknown function (DUF3551)